MIYVIATITVKEGARKDFIKIFKDNVPAVKAENGCLCYEPTIDFDTGFPAQGGVRPNVVTIVEQWESLDHLKKHLQAPHMLKYKENVKDLVVGSTSLQVLEPA